MRAKKGSLEDKIRPFTKTQIRRILKAFDTDEFVNPVSRYSHSHYSSFVKFLFITGCRLGEAAGLTWSCIDFDTRVVTISQALGKDMSRGPSKTRKIIKETKTGWIRNIPMNDALYLLLWNLFLTRRKPSQSSKDFVFKGHLGSYIDVPNFRTGVWKKILEACNIEYRYPYMSRHTVLSEVTASHGLPAAAKLAGHRSLNMVSMHYVRYIGDLDEVLPEL